MLIVTLKQVFVDLNGTLKPFKNLGIKRTEFENPSHEIHAPITETIHKNGPHADKFGLAKRNKIMNLIYRGTSAVVLCRETDQNFNLLPPRFVLATIRKEHDSEVLEIRFVIGEHRYRWKSSLFYVQSNVRQSPVRMLLALASILGLNF